MTKVQDAAERALHSGEEFGHAYWDMTAPISDDPRTSGDLRRSWFAHVRPRYRKVVLTIGAATRYVVYVELGVPSRGILPRAPVRTTAGEIAAIMPYYLNQELADI